MTVSRLVHASLAVTPAFIRSYRVIIAVGNHVPAISSEKVVYLRFFFHDFPKCSPSLLIDSHEDVRFHNHLELLLKSYLHVDKLM